jgi:hypothetical protein
MVGAGAQLKAVQFSGPDDPRIPANMKHLAHKLPLGQASYIVEEIRPSETGLPTSHLFDGADPSILNADGCMRTRRVRVAAR